MKYDNKLKQAWSKYEARYGNVNDFDSEFGKSIGLAQSTIKHRRHELGLVINKNKSQKISNNLVKFKADSIQDALFTDARIKRLSSQIDNLEGSVTFLKVLTFVSLGIGLYLTYNQF